MACAQTGSGKTASFLFPIIHQLIENNKFINSNSYYNKPSSPNALILAPTRELTTQIYDEARKFLYKTGIKTVAVYGGADPRYQISQLRRGCNILCATPGRLVDLMNRGYVTLKNIGYLVLDEADRMLVRIFCFN